MSKEHNATILKICISLLKMKSETPFMQIQEPLLYTCEIIYIYILFIYITTMNTAQMLHQYFIHTTKRNKWTHILFLPKDTFSAKETKPFRSGKDNAQNVQRREIQDRKAEKGKIIIKVINKENNTTGWRRKERDSHFRNIKYIHSFQDKSFRGYKKKYIQM